MKSKMTYHFNKTLTEEEKAAIVEFFLLQKNNTIPAIAKEFNISTYKVSRIIDEYFKNNLQNVLRSEKSVVNLPNRYNKTDSIMAVKIKQSELNDGKEFRFENEEDTLDVWFETGGPNWINKFRMRFNGELTTFKTLITLNRNINVLIEKYELKKIDDEDAEE